jgi:hypothetical protein
MTGFFLDAWSIVFGTGAPLPDGGRIDLTLRRPPTPVRRHRRNRPLGARVVPANQEDDLVISGSFVIRAAAAAFGILLLAAPAGAADAVFPLGSRLGLKPPGDMKVSTRFRGFEDPTAGASILMLEVPPQAYADLEKEMSPAGFKKQGMTEEKRETLTLAAGKGTLVTGEQQVESKKLRKWIFLASSPDWNALVAVQVPDEAKSKYPDAAVRTALLTLVNRPSIPMDEQLSLVPFTFTELSGLRPFRVIGFNSVLLTDGATDPKDPAAQPLMIVAAAPGGPEQTPDRDNFARNLFASLTDFKDVRIVGSDVLRLDNQQTHEIQAEAKDPKSDTPMKLVQWVRFGNGGFIRFVGIARADAWPAAFPKFRAVRDGTKPKL